MRSMSVADIFGHPLRHVARLEHGDQIRRVRCPWDLPDGRCRIGSRPDLRLGIDAGPLASRREPHTDGAV